MNSDPRPKECIQELESHYSFIDILYNQKLNKSWVVVCENEDETIRVKGNSHIHTLRSAVEKKREN